MFADRTAAGRELATLLAGFSGQDKLLVLALPRGGVPVALEIARQLGAPLDVLVVRKLGLPWQPELAGGAIGPGGALVMNPEMQTRYPDLEAILAPVIRRERAEMLRREALYRAGRPALDARRSTVILVDDGIATGATMEAAVLAMKARGAHSIVIAVPVAPADAADHLAGLVDLLVCPQRPRDLVAVGHWYGNFAQLDDAEVLRMLHESTRNHAPGEDGSSPATAIARPRTRPG
jgi:putative phosphoribosyl transferase